MEVKEKKQKSNWYAIGAIAAVVCIICLGALYKNSFQQKLEAKSRIESNSKNEAVTGGAAALTKKQQLEQYLLNKRLELKKYFVFNLGKEVKTNKECPTTCTNYRVTRSQLENDLSKLAFNYKNKLKNEGKEVIAGLQTKNLIIFLGDSFSSFNNEWTKNSLDQKITNGNDMFVIFEKDADFENVYFEAAELSREGNIAYPWCNYIRLRMDHPTVKICKSKEEALKILKTDPALDGKF